MDDYLEEITESNDDREDFIDSLDDGCGREKPEWHEELDDTEVDVTSLFS